MKEFVFRFPTKLVFGAGRLREAGKLASGLGERCLVVVGSGSARSHGYLDTLIKSLKDKGLSYSIYEGVSPNPRHTEADEAGEIARTQNADSVIALGGGSVMDAAKLAAVVAVLGGSSWDYITGQRKISDALPIMAVPTLAASGSEVAAGAVITNLDLRQKRGVGSQHLVPRIALWDPETTLTVPKKPTMDGAVDILAHILERFFNGLGDSPIADRFAVALMKETAEASRRLLGDLRDLHARENLALASSLAITSLTDLGRGGTFTAHSFEHVLSGRHDEISHGTGLAALMPGWCSWMFRSYPGRGDRLNTLWGGDFLEFLSGWIEDLGLAPSISRLGVDEEEIPILNNDLWELYSWSVSGMSREDTMRIWRDCFGG